MSDTALILIDIQNDYFEDGNWPVHEMQKVSENAARLLAHTRENGNMVVHIHHEIPSDEAPFFRPGTYGAEIHASVAPNDGELVILKHKPNSFQDTSLKQNLDANGIQNLIICGAMSQMCIDATARAAADFGYAIMVIEDACGPKEANFDGVEVPASVVHAAFMAPLAMSYGEVLTCDGYLASAE